MGVVMGLEHLDSMGSVQNKAQFVIFVLT